MCGYVQEEVELRILFNKFMETGRSFPSRHKATPRSSRLQGKDSKSFSKDDVDGNENAKKKAIESASFMYSDVFI